MSIRENDLEDLRYAKSLPENPSLAARITHMIGKPVEKGFDLLPANFHAIVSYATTKALNAALEGAITTLDKKPGRKSDNVMHKLAVAATGGTGDRCRRLERIYGPDIVKKEYKSLGSN